MGARTRVIGWLAALGVAAGASAQQAQIEIAEPVKLRLSGATPSIDVHGLRFDLALEPNERLLQGVPAARKASLANVQLLRGRVDGRPGSWVRLTRTGDRVSGAFWDGDDLYMIARHHDIAPFLATPIAASPDDAVVYRLSDTRNLLPPNFCATGAGASGAQRTSGLAQYESLVAELKIAFTGVPTDQLDISLVADSYLTQQYANDPPPYNDVRIKMLEALNIVDGIFDAQLGLMVTASELHTVPAASDTLVADEPGALLDQLRDYRAAVPALRAKPISHLFSSRVLEQGAVLGIANIGGACSVTDGVSLTSLGFSGFAVHVPFVMAHEIGHNLNAQHDTAACGERFLMWPEYSGSLQGRFSQCSLDQIRPFIAQNRGACITAAQYGDVETRVGAIPEQLRTEPFTWPVYVRSAGNLPVTNATVVLDLGFANLDGITPTQGTCAPYFDYQRCELGTIAPGAEARVDLRITANSLGDLDLRATGDAANDRYDSNNVATGRVNVAPPAIIGIGVTPSSRNALVGDVVSFEFSVTSSGRRTARDVTLQMDGSYLTVVSSSTTQGTCNTTYCNLGDIPGGTTVRVTANVRATQGGALSFGATMASSNAWYSQPGVSATLNATARLDLAIDPQLPLRLVAVGVPFDIVVPVRANGTRPAVGGLFRMSLSGPRFLSAHVDGVPCARELLLSAQGSGCPLGTLNPGDTRTVTVRAQFDAPDRTNVTMMAEIANDELASNNQVTVLYEARFATDVSLTMFPDGFRFVEDTEFDVAVAVRSQGAQDAVDVTTTLDVPVGLRIVSASMPQATCTPSGERRIACVRPVIPVNGEAQLTARLAGVAPGLYTPTWTVQAANDGAPGNNTRNFTVNIRPRADVGIQPIPALPGFVVGQPREFVAEVFTSARHPVADVVVTFPSSDGLVAEVLTPTGTCVANSFQVRCALGTLPPSTTVRLTARYRATRAGWGLAGGVRVDSPDDTNFDNNDSQIRIDTYDVGDVEARVGSATVSGTVGAVVTLPRITLNTLIRSYDIRVQIPLPAFATLEAISGNTVCGGGSGGAPLECYISQREAGSSDSLDITVRLDSAGTFTSHVVVRAMNDTNAANDSASFQVQSNAVVTPQPPATGGGSGGGGGGRIDGWLLLALAAAAGLGRTGCAFPAGNCGTRRDC